jgi:hypothetical protein
MGLFAFHRLGPQVQREEMSGRKLVKEGCLSEITYNKTYSQVLMGP